MGCRAHPSGTLPRGRRSESGLQCGIETGKEDFPVCQSADREVRVPNCETRYPKTETIDSVAERQRGGHRYSATPLIASIIGRLYHIGLGSDECVTSRQAISSGRTHYLRFSF